MNKTSITFIINHLSENALVITFGNIIAKDVLLQIRAYNEKIKKFPFPGFRTTVPAYTTLTVFYDPMKVIRSAMPGVNAFERVSSYLTNISSQSITSIKTKADRITIPVCYDESLGPDIAELAALHQLNAIDVIKLHSETVYTVYMIGFVPGFAYLGGMTERLSTPRKANPRKAVPAGSVGIAGQQTGIYPLETPGGWQIIGRTPVILFDATRQQPLALKAGDEVVFKPISLEEFERLSHNNEDHH